MSPQLLDQVRDFALDVAAARGSLDVASIGTRCPSSACTLLMQCASQQRHKLPRSDWLLALSRLCLTASRACGQSRGTHAPSQDSAGASLLDRQTWWSRVTNVGPVRHRAIDSSDLRLTTDRDEGRQGPSGPFRGANPARPLGPQVRPRCGLGHEKGPRGVQSEPYIEPMSSPPRRSRSNARDGRLSGVPPAGAITEL